MLYFNTRGGQHIVVLEPGHFELLKAGETVFTPNKAVMLCYTPDSVWLGEQLIINADRLTPELIDRLIAESQKRPEKLHARDFPTMQVIKDGKVQSHES